LLPRASILKHPLGITVETPLLVPSFSSKGFAVNKKTGESEVKEAFEYAKSFLTDAMLVSAYDIYYKRLPPLSGAITDIVFVDSGGYETADAHDMQAVFVNPWPIEEWKINHLKSVYDTWPDFIQAVFVNYDHGKERKPLKEQLTDAKSLLSKYPRQMRAFIIKPETPEQKYVQHDSIMGNLSELGSFDIIGITEKELENSLFRRMVAIAKLRRALDAEGISTPIHIFGSLDPLTTVLYFLAGAEIFDGLTWLRYSYIDGFAAYRYNYVALKEIREIDANIKMKNLSENIKYLMNLKYDLKTYLNQKNFSCFSHHATFFERAYAELCSAIKIGVK
jgi:hypothetical protein